jgi:hypothetical protein
MGSSDVIATIALVVSAASGWVSWLAFRHGVRAKNEERRMAFARQKSEFLVRIDKARKTFDALASRLDAVIARLQSLSPIGAADLRRLQADRDYVEGCKRQAWSLWEEAYEMSEGGLAHHGPRYLGLIEDDEDFARRSDARCAALEARLASTAARSAS